VWLSYEITILGYAVEELEAPTIMGPGRGVEQAIQVPPPAADLKESK
jgi:hypothetical protein